MPKVSVLMPVYNTKEEYLREAIESILNQTFSDFEFIIINDGSTNNAKDVILSYTDPRIKYFEQENKGLISTLNRGLDLCQGEYIARMDSDDISLPERFEKQVKILDSYANVGIVGSAIKYFPNEKIIMLKEFPKFFDMIIYNQLAHPAVMIKNYIIKKFNLKYENFIHAEDYELWSRLIKYTDICNIQEVLLNYRIHESSISIACHKEQEKTARKIQLKMLKFLTDDEEILKNLQKIIYSEKRTLLEKIFSVKKYYNNNKKQIILYILGIKLTFRCGKESN